MAPPVIETTSPATVSSGSGSMTFNYPTGIVSGDLLIHVSVGNGAFLGKTGWVQEFNNNNAISGFSSNQQAFSRVADGTETGSDTWPLANSFIDAASLFLRISGAEDPATTAIVSVSSQSGLGGNAISPDATATDDDSLSLRTVCARRSSNAQPTVEDHTFVDTSDQGGNEIDVFEDVVNSGATGTKAVTYSPGWWAAPAVGVSVLLIAPTAVGPGPGPSWPGYDGFSKSGTPFFGGIES